MIVGVYGFIEVVVGEFGFFMWMVENDLMFYCWLVLLLVECLCVVWYLVLMNGIQLCVFVKFDEYVQVFVVWLFSVGI